MRINRAAVHARYDGHCAYCGQEITLKAMQVDHIWPKHLGGTDEMDNLAPACRQCNHYKRGYTVPTFRGIVLTLHERVANIYIHKVAVNFGIATITPWDGKFYFERLAAKLNNNCPEFPHFGVSYPDARCIDGYLWDLDKCENGQLYGGGDDPCPFCNTEAYKEWCGWEDADEPGREKISERIKALKAKYQPSGEAGNG